MTDDRATAPRAMVVTGAGSGIGAAVAERAAHDGWQLTLAGRRRDRLDQVAARCAGRADVHVADVADPDAAGELVAAAVRRWGRLDCVVTNAGVMAAGTVLETEPAEWDRVLATNLTAAYLLARAALPALLDAHGSLVAVASIAALRAPSGSAAYAVSKAGLVMLAQTVARDFGGSGVRANVVCPGWVRTEMADEEMAAFGTPYGLDRDASYDEITRLVPQGRPAHAHEVAAAVTWLAGPDASYVNGACLVVDGGTVLVDPGTVGFDFTVTARNPRDSQ
jgi:NAD(P)-dependent dehydrogenase (short-subunit alcohol dehydrogenase family)